MQFQFDVASGGTGVIRPPQPQSVMEVMQQLVDLHHHQFNQMNQLLELQREHLNHVRTVAQENLARWRNLLARWKDDQPELAEHCKTAYPLVERAYVQLLAGVVREVAELGDDALDNDFSLQEFLDRYGQKVGQLSHLLSIIGPLSEAAQQNEAAAKQA
jgi:hypothetical protein